MIAEQALLDALEGVNTGRLRVNEAYRAIRAAETSTNHHEPLGLAGRCGQPGPAGLHLSCDLIANHSGMHGAYDHSGTQPGVISVPHRTHWTPRGSR